MYTKLACQEQIYFRICWFITNLHVQKPFLGEFLVLYQTCMLPKEINVWSVGFMQHLHVQKTNLCLEFWVYTTFACPENQIIFGILVLYKLCMSINSKQTCFILCVWFFGFTQNLYVQNTNLFVEFGLYTVTKCACPETFFLNVWFIPNLYVHKHLFLELWFYTKCVCTENSAIFVCFLWFILNLHVHNTSLFLKFWFYTKLACPENHFIVGV